MILLWIFFCEVKFWQNSKADVQEALQLYKRVLCDRDIEWLMPFLCLNYWAQHCLTIHSVQRLNLKQQNTNNYVVNIWPLFLATCHLIDKYNQTNSSFIDMTCEGAYFRIIFQIRNQINKIIASIDLRFDRSACDILLIIEQYLCIIMSLYHVPGLWRLPDVMFARANILWKCKHIPLQTNCRSYWWITKKNACCCTVHAKLHAEITFHSAQAQSFISPNPSHQKLTM